MWSRRRERRAVRPTPRFEKWTAAQFKDRKIKFALPNVDAPENHPKVLWISYCGNLIGTSMRGHELNLQHMVGTHHNVLGGEGRAKDMVKEIDWSTDAPLGKLDLIYNVNLRMDLPANYSTSCSQRRIGTRNKL